MGFRLMDFFSRMDKEAIALGEARMQIRGVSAAFMDLAYGDQFPNGLDTFACEQTKGIEKGDEYGEFVVTRK